MRILCGLYGSLRPLDLIQPVSFPFVKKRSRFPASRTVRPVVQRSKPALRPCAVPAGDGLQGLTKLGYDRYAFLYYP